MSACLRLWVYFRGSPRASKTAQGALQVASKSSPGQLWKTPSHLQRLFRSGFGDPKPPPRSLPKLQESRLPATSPRGSKSPRGQDAKNEISHHSLGNDRGSESACCHLQHHKMQSFSKPTTAKASFCITPKEIIEIRKMQSFIAIDFGLRSILRYYESSTPAIPTATRMLRDY